jgi:hypothetical protein
MFSVGCFDQNGKTREIAACISFEFDATYSFLHVAGYFFNDFLILNAETLTWSNETGAVHGDVKDGRSRHHFQTCSEMIYLF